MREGSTAVLWQKVEEVSKLKNTFEFVEVLNYLKKESGALKILRWDT